MTMGISLIEVVGCIWALMAFLVGWVTADSFPGARTSNFGWKFLCACVIAAVLMVASYLLMRLAFHAWPYLDRLTNINVKLSR